MPADWTGLQLPMSQMATRASQRHCVGRFRCCRFQQVDDGLLARIGRGRPIETSMSWMRSRSGSMFKRHTGVDGSATILSTNSLGNGRPSGADAGLAKHIGVVFDLQDRGQPAKLCSRKSRSNLRVPV